MTELLYMQSFEVEACDAKVIKLTKTEDDQRVDMILDKTCFYARGGGQDWDTGNISKTSAAFEVEEVHLNPEGQVHHIGHVTEGQFNIGDNVDCRVDHDRRHVNTRLHSAGHVIDMAIDSLGLDWIATKGQHYPNLSAVEYAGTWVSERADELRVQIEDRTNYFIDRGGENKIKFMPVDEMYEVCRHVPENIPKNKPGRVVIYGDNFGIPCGGTHVTNLEQIGATRIPKVKEKKGVIRVSYTVDGINS